MGVDETILNEIRQFKQEVTESLKSVHERLDRQDLNHAAEYLREFGYFLERNPQFMLRHKVDEERRQEREIVREYFIRVFHLGNWRSKLGWLSAGIAAGFLFAFGNALFGPFNGIGNELHNFILHIVYGK